MTKPAVSRMHYNCYTYQQNKVASCLWSLKRYEHARHVSLIQRLKKFFSLTNRGVKKKYICSLRNQHVLYTPKSDNQNCHWEQKTFNWFGINVQVFDCQLSARKKKSKLLVRWFLYHSRYEWFIIVTQYMAGLLSYVFMSTDSWVCFCIFIHLLCYVLLFFCSSAFTSCLVCESTGLHLILVLMEMCGAAPGGHNNMLHLVS